MIDVFRYENKRKLVGNRIKTEREVRKWTQSELATIISQYEPARKDRIIKQSTIATWENGVTLPPIGRLIILAHIFECDIAYLLGDIECRTHQQTDIVQYTGLTTKAIEALKKETERSSGASKAVELVSYLIENVDLQNISKQVYEIVTLSHLDLLFRTRRKTDKEIGFESFIDGRVVLPPAESRKFKTIQILNDIQSKLQNGLATLITKTELETHPAKKIVPGVGSTRDSNQGQ